MRSVTATLTLKWDEYVEAFRTEAVAAGRSVSFIEHALAYAEPLHRAGLPILYDAETVAFAVGFDPAILRELLKNPRRLYISFSIAKRNGGERHIDQPVPSLMEIQRWILEKILYKCVVHPAATAFIPKSSILVNARPHASKRMVLAIDIENFFSSIHGDSVFRVFSRLGYSSRVCSFLRALVTFRDRLPQGAPTSPMLSNVVMYRFDEKMAAICSTSGISYTRYADDITLSGEFHPGMVVARCRRELARLELRLNESKTRLMLPHQRQEVTGIVVNNEVPRAPREVRRRLRQENYYINKFGLDSHESKVDSLLENRSDHLRGIAEFVRFVDPEDLYAKETIQLLGRVRFEKTNRIR